ncbi:MAG: hypothetical protein QOG49_257, partial [Frankiaceae bacterium]|nr:hypothetical protein [Frankiaceae bacterium]
MSPIDDELRRTLSGRAEQVAPLSDPIAGIEARARRLHRRRQAIGAACAVIAFAGGAAVVPLLSRNTSPAPSPGLTAKPSPTPTVTAPPATNATPPAVVSPSPTTASSAVGASSAPVGPAVAAAVYYLHDTGTRLVLQREWRRVPQDDRVMSAVRLMLDKPLDPDYQTLWPSATFVNTLQIGGGEATVGLSAPALTGHAGSEAACLSLQQLVWTVTAADPTIKRVTLSVEGQTQGVVSQWWGVGCGPDGPMTRHAPSYDVLAPVQISTYNDGDRVKSRFSFGGEATVFEATVSWSVVDAGGKQLAGGSAQASAG